MIIRMSKVEIAGSRRLIEDVLYLLRETGTFQIDPDSVSFIGESREYIKPSLPNSDNLAERLYLENLRDKVSELFSYLPEIDVRKSYIEPPSIIDTITETLKKHVAFCKELSQKRDTLRNEMNELNRYTPFLDAIEPLLKGVGKTHELDLIGLTIKYPEDVEHLKELLSRLTDKKIEIFTTTDSDGTIAGLIVTESKTSNMIKKILSDERIPELSFPSSLKELSLPEKITFLKQRISELSLQIAEIDQQLRMFSKRWSPIYRKVKEWVEERLSILGVTTSAFQTRMCFFIYGWMPSQDVEMLRKILNRKFDGKVTIEEKEIQEEDLERVPVVLKNPAYFQPFELFTRLLPLPKYTSYDPTPFIGIFFPIFFGMILGDAGYGLVLLIASLILIKKFRGIIQNASKILSVCSAYSILFGVIYGEFFGELPKLLGFEYIHIDRRAVIIPMLFFAVTVGVVHIILGLFLGLMSSLRKKAKRETLYKFLSIIFILCVVVLVASLFEIFPQLLTKPIVLAILILAPFLLFTGGILAPLELLKSIGNIISYARIMAIGLSSVLLAFVANHIGGLTGDILIGIIVAGLLHIINIAFGTFSSTIHSMRLHYVEFFGKFIVHGGRRFEPLKK